MGILDKANAIIDKEFEEKLVNKAKILILKRSEKIKEVEEIDLKLTKLENAEDVDIAESAQTYTIAAGSISAGTIRSNF